MKKNRVHHHESRTASREVLIALAVLMATTLGTTIPLYIHNASQTSSQIEAIRADVKSMQHDMRAYHADIQSEMRDFHGRLIAIEERNKNNPPR